MNMEARVSKLEAKSPATQYWASCIVDIGQDRETVMAAAIDAYRAEHGLSAAIEVNCIVRQIVSPKESA